MYVYIYIYIYIYMRIIVWAEYMGYTAETPAPPAAMRRAVWDGCRLACNSHTITDAELRPVGVGIFALAALVIPSCQPTT